MIDQSTLECIQALGTSNATTSDVNMGADCSQALEIGFFFDGISRNLEQDIQSGNVSNIGRLYSAYPERAQGTIAHKFYRHYYSGLGTPFDSSLSDDVVGAAHRVPGEAVGTGEGQLRSSGTDAAKEVLSGGGSGRWYEVFGRSFKVSITQPWNWVKSARDAAIRTGIEAAAPIRDTSIAANLLMSGSHTRLSSAVRDFHNSVADVKQNSELPLVRIRVSVFGFDFGAAMAKAFVRRLLDEVCDQDGERFVYQDSDVEVVFVGLLDCVDRTHAEMGPLDWFHPLTPVLDDGGELHPGCQRALHLIAAHERRFYRRCRPLGAENSQWHEELCPGISEDIGGGLKPDEQKASAELSRAALHRMYRRATIAGFPSHRWIV